MKKEIEKRKKVEKKERKHRERNIRKTEEKEKRNQMHMRLLLTSLNYLITLSNTNTLLLNSKKRMK